MSASNQDLYRLAQEIRQQFVILHNQQQDREAQMIAEIQAVKQQIAELLDQQTEALQARSDSVNRSVRRNSWLAQRNAQLMIGSIALLFVTIGIMLHADPVRVRDAANKLLPIVGAVWIGYVAVMLNIKPPSTASLSEEPRSAKPIDRSF